MQETGDGLRTMLFILGTFAMMTMVLWLFLPFAIFGIKRRLDNILDEQRRTTSAVEEIGQEALHERPQPREIGEPDD
ncbi:hypothetical protein LCGC14_0746210 [marine sediment metagenome]|uniref:Uncharacterized protein n=1 Tax=marine sediment metagenome TaxID=412755 RepID=A0A0F9SQB0_9ZZZZ